MHSPLVGLRYTKYTTDMFVFCTAAMFEKTRWNPRTRMQTRARKQTQTLFDTLVGHSCKTLLYAVLLRDTLVGHSCGTLFWDTLAENSCGRVLWDILVENCSGHSLLDLWDYFVALCLSWDTFEGDFCRTLTRVLLSCDTLVVCHRLDTTM